MNVAYSDAWPTLKRYLEERIEDNRSALEAHLNEVDTAKRRGAIMELRSLIDAVESDALKS